MLVATDSGSQQQYQDLLGKYEASKSEKAATSEKLKKAQDNFARKELEYRTQLVSHADFICSVFIPHLVSKHFSLKFDCFVSIR